MFFSGIPGLWREADFLFIRGEYHNIKFHVNEIACIRITDRNGTVYTPDRLPLKKAGLQFQLKSGRTKTCNVRHLTRRKYQWLLNLLNRKG